MGAPKKLEFLNSLEKIYKNQISKTQNSLKAVDMMKRETTSLEKRRPQLETASRENSIEDAKRPHSNCKTCLIQNTSKCISASSSSLRPSTLCRVWRKIPV